MFKYKSYWLGWIIGGWNEVVIVVVICVCVVLSYGR